MPENEESLNQTRLFERNPILNLGGNCHGLCCNFTLYCMKHWNENTEDILHGWNKKLKKNIYAEHPSDRFAERTHQFQFMQDAYKKHRQGIKIEEDASFVESLFGVRNGESESPGSNMIGLDFPSAGGGHIIEIVKRRDGYLIYDPNDDELRFAEIHEKADRIINSRARGQYQFFTDFHIIAMDEYLRSIDMIGTMGKPKRKDEQFRAKLA
ncbi:MAG: hypothetical protein KA998_04990, partial [Rickettsiaceae bacterium]|nr:hypothetical protein [Rickettsiaceae bacterium]